MAKTWLHYNVQTPLTQKTSGVFHTWQQVNSQNGNSTPQALRVLPIWDGCDAPRDPVAKRDGG